MRQHATQSMQCTSRDTVPTPKLDACDRWMKFIDSAYKRMQCLPPVTLTHS